MQTGPKSHQNRIEHNATWFLLFVVSEQQKATAGRGNARGETANPIYWSFKKKVINGTAQQSH